MKIRASRTDLFNAANKVKAIITRKAVLPILSHVLLVAKKNERKENVLTITSSDLRVNMECTVPCDIEQPGQLTVSADRFFSAMANFPEDEVMIALTDNRVVEIRCAKIKMKLFSMSPEDFPPVRPFDGVEPITLPQKDLKNLFSKTSFAICTDQARYNLMGLLMELDDGKITCVSTDGRRMALCRYECKDFDLGLRRKVTVPGKVISEVERLLTDEGEVELLLDENQVAFSLNSVRLTSALIEGSFPNYEMVIPKKHDKEVFIDRALFTDAVTRARGMTNERFNSVRFIIGNNMLLLRVSTPDVGEYEEDMAAEYDGEQIEIAFNPDFILDVLRTIDTEQIAFVLKDANSPGVIKPVEKDDGKQVKVSDNHINVIMPIRI